MGQNEWREAMRKAGLTEEFLLSKTDEIIEAIESGQFKPRNKDKVLRKLKFERDQLLMEIQQMKGGENG